MKHQSYRDTAKHGEEEVAERLKSNGLGVAMLLLIKILHELIYQILGDMVVIVVTMFQNLQIFGDAGVLSSTVVGWV